VSSRRWAGIAFAIVAVIATGGCWTQQGFGPDRAGYNPFEVTIGASNVTQLQRVWSADLGFAVRGPVVGGNHVVAVGNGTYAFDLVDGHQFWHQDHAADCADPNSYICPALGPPVLLSATTALVPWDSYRNFGGAGGFVYSLDTGQYTNNSSGDGGTHIAPAIRSDVHAYSGYVDSPDGTGPWFGWVDWGGDHPGFVNSTYITPPMLLGRFVYVGGDKADAFSFDSCTPAPELQGSPFEDWCAPTWSVAGGGEPTAVSSDSVAFGGQILDATTGALRWTADAGSAYLLQPAVAQGRLYYGSNDGYLRVYDANGCGAPTCAPIWKGYAGGPITQQPAVANGVVYVVTRTNVVAFDIAGCHAPSCNVWHARVAAGTDDDHIISTSPVVAGGRVLVGTSAGALVAFGLPN
jgi:hypothetical protein